MRMNLVWDGIRFDKGSPDFNVTQVWMTNVRDDCIENDHLLDGTIRDSLFDGCFAGISVATIDDNKARPTVKVSDVLLRMQEYPYRGKMGHAMPIKIKVGGPKFAIKDSIFAVSTDNLIGGKHAPVMWNTVTECSNNTLLWLGEGDLPEIYGDVPDCFEVISGETAHQVWAKARADWIAEHPDIPRLEGDPVE
jgi:hypothetical protein